MNKDTNKKVYRGRKSNRGNSWATQRIKISNRKPPVPVAVEADLEVVGTSAKKQNKFHRA